MDDLGSLGPIRLPFQFGKPALPKPPVVINEQGPTDATGSPVDG